MCGCRSLLAMFCLGSLVASLNGAYVEPQMGGAQIGQGSAPMKHIDITFNGSSIGLHLDESIPIPVLRPLEEPDEFDPSSAWGVLGSKAYNFQYGWNAGGFLSVPVGTWIWIEQLEATVGLEAYQRIPATPPYAPIFGTSGASTRWRWSGQMTHNVYAVQDPIDATYEARYRVYLGADRTGEPLPQYGSDEVRLTFHATPVLRGDFNQNDVYDCGDIDLLATLLAGDYFEVEYDLDGDAAIAWSDFETWLILAGQHDEPVTGGGAYLPADANLDGAVNQLDLDVWRVSRFSTNAAWCNGDFNLDGTVDVRDFNVWNRWKYQSSATYAQTLPEPTAATLLVCLGSAVITQRRKGAKARRGGRA